MADTMNQMDDDVLVKCENVSKKFCRGLKRSLWYGVQDICAEINPFWKNNTAPGKDNIPALRKDEFWAVKGISFELKRGECLGLIGHNGAGKSTLLKMLNGLIKPDHGRITMKGRIGALIELNAGFNPILTGRENVYIYGAILGFSKKEIDSKYESIVEFAEMKDFMEMPFRSYSSGMKVRLGFAVAAQMGPDVLIIDEVLAVGDVKFRAKCFNVIGTLCRNSAVILVSHSMPDISRISTELLVMSQGNLSYHGYDISKGINEYITFSTNQRRIIGGNGRAKIHNIKIESNPPNEPGKIIFLDNLKILMGINLEPDIQELVIDVMFLDTSMHPVAQSNSLYNKEKLKCRSNNFDINIEIKEMNLTPGMYYIVISLLNKSLDELYVQYYAHNKLHVAGDFIGRAPVQFNSLYIISS